MANYLKINKYDTVDGPGVRVSVYFSGCPFHCKGCHNPESWSFDAGKPFGPEALAEIMQLCSSEYISGLSILGGEPLAEQNIFTVAILTAFFKYKFPDKTIWVWTGYEWDELMLKAEAKEVYRDVLEDIDVAVVGRFELDKRDITKENLWRGSKNQRIIKCKESLHSGKIVFLENILNND